MNKKVYIETTVISYLTARPSRDIVISAHQQITQEWWDKQRLNFELCISELVVTEAAAGDPNAAQLRLNVLQNIAVLETTQVALDIAKELIIAGALPMKAINDAIHISVAAAHSIPFLMTWNCRHLANATMRPMIESVCESNGLVAPIICTPEELLETDQ